MGFPAIERRVRGAIGPPDSTWRSTRIALGRQGNSDCISAAHVYLLFG